MPLGAGMMVRWGSMHDRTIRDQFLPSCPQFGHSGG